MSTIGLAQFLKLVKMILHVGVDSPSVSMLTRV